MATFNDMPYEIIKYIYDFVCLDNTPLFNYRMRFINKNLKNIVDNHTEKICRHIDDNVLDKNILFDKGNYKIYKWLFDHKIYMTYTDVSNLIVFNRIDILNLMMNYENNIKILFNRFYLTDCNIIENFNIFSFGNVNRSFLLLGCEFNNLDIVKFFLEKSNKNMYYIQLNAAIDICIEKNNKDIINYIYNNYKNKLNNTTLLNINKYNII